MNAVILLSVVAILIFAIWGWKVGLIRRVLEFVGLVASFLAATHFASLTGDWLAEGTGMRGGLAVAVSWIVVFLAGLILTRMVAWAISKAMGVSILGFFDRLGGAVVGLLIGTLLVSALLVGASLVPGGEDVRAAFNKHPVSSLIYNAAPGLYIVLQKVGVDKRRVLVRLYEQAKDHAAFTGSASDSEASEESPVSGG